MPKHGREKSSPVHHFYSASKVNEGLWERALLQPSGALSILQGTSTEGGPFASSGDKDAFLALRFLPRAMVVNGRVSFLGKDKQ